MTTLRPLPFLIVGLVAVASGLRGSAQGVDTLLNFANAGKVKPPAPVSRVEDGVRVPVGTTSADGSIGVAADAAGVKPGTRTAIYRDCEDEILLVPEGTRVEDVSKPNCDYERVSFFSWGQRDRHDVELNTALSSETLGALQVVVDRDGQPIPDARVTIAQDSGAVTDRGAGATGTAMLTLAPGDYTATVTAGGQTVQGDVTVEANAVTSVTADADRGQLSRNETPYGQYRPIPTSQADDGYMVSAADLGGLLSVRVDAPIGQTYLAFPSVASVGQPVSWSAITLPAGGTPEEVAENQSRLTAQIVTVNRERYALADGTRWTMTAQSTLSISVGDDEVRIAFQMTLATALSRPIPRHPEDPIAARAGWPVRIAGMFDGRFDTTALSMGGAPVDVVAESATAIYFNPPVNLLGTQLVSITEAGDTWQVPIRNIGLDMSVDQNDLWTGQATPLHVTATGLAGITSPAFMVLINRTPGIIAMSQGNHQFWLIHPRDVEADGTASYDRAVRGIMRGGFSVDGILMVY